MNQSKAFGVYGNIADDLTKEIMKKIAFSSIITLLFVILIVPTAWAERAEKVKVIKTDLDHYDTIVQLQNDERWLIQHHRICHSQNTEFPIELIYSDDNEVERVKTAPNEICTVYNAVPYSGEARLTRLSKSENLIIPDYEAEMVWFGKNYEIQYGAGCRNIRDFVGRRVYLSLPNDELRGGQLVLPGNRGQCPITFVKQIGVVEDTVEAPDALTGVDYQAQNSQVYFYWNRPEAIKERLLYLISYSRHRIEISDYNWWEMPNLNRTLRNSKTINRLANNRQYYFYLAAMGLKNRVVSEWIEIKATPLTAEHFENSGADPEEFEIDVEEKGDKFVLSWPDKKGVKRYRLKYYLNGKYMYFKYLKEGQNEWIIDKKDEDIGSRMKLSISSIPQERFGPVHRDTIAWKYEAEE